MEHTACLVCLVCAVSGCCENTLVRAIASSGHITKLEQSTFLGYLWLCVLMFNMVTSNGGHPLHHHLRLSVQLPLQQKNHQANLHTVAASLRTVVHPHWPSRPLISTPRRQSTVIFDSLCSRSVQIQNPHKPKKLEIMVSTHKKQLSILQ